LDEARRLFGLGVAQFPLADRFWQGFAVASLALDNTDDAVRALEELARRDPENKTLRSQLARLADERGDAHDTRRWAREVLFVDLEDVAAHLLLARVAAAGKEWYTAREEFDRALFFDPASSEAVCGLARCEHATGERQAAIARLQDHLRRHPDDAIAAPLLDEVTSSSPTPPSTRPAGGVE